MRTTIADEPRSLDDLPEPVLEAATMHTMTASLRLVHPPISNQHADLLLDDPEARAILDGSKIYMIAARRELEFFETFFDEPKQQLTFEVGFADRRANGRLDVGQMCNALGNIPGHVEVEGFTNWINVYHVKPDGQRVRLLWFTPDSFLWDAWRQHDFVHLEGSVRDFARYELLYIGMSHDSAFKRLVAKPHEARLKILTNELVRGKESRVSDEVMFFFYDVEALFVSIFGDNDEIDDVAAQMALNPAKNIPPELVIEDVEKAFIQMLKTPYNRRLYKKYPAIANGLHDSVLKRYGYVIAEDVVFTVNDVEVVGGYRAGLPCSEEADFIFINESKASFIDISENQQIDFGG